MQWKLDAHGRPTLKKSKGFVSGFKRGLNPFRKDTAKSRLENRLVAIIVIGFFVGIYLLTGFNIITFILS